MIVKDGDEEYVVNFKSGFTPPEKVCAGCYIIQPSEVINDEGLCSGCA